MQASVRAFALALLAAGGLSLRPAAQSPPAFEVVSIKPNTSAEAGARVAAQPGGRFTMTNIPVSAIVLVAYELQDVFQVDGLPEWSQTERFDVMAQAPAGVPIAFPGQNTALPGMQARPAGGTLEAQGTCGETQHADVRPGHRTQRQLPRSESCSFVV